MNSRVTSTKKRVYQEEEDLKPHKNQSVKNFRLITRKRIYKRKRLYNIIVVEVTYEESLKGCKKRISFNRICLCPCVNVDRKKRINETEKETENDYPSVACKLCDGIKKLVQSQHENISIPAGVKNKMFQKIYGLGDYGPEGTAGDLIVVFKVEEHPDFIREGNDAILTILLPQSRLVQENSITIPTLYNGQLWLTIPPNILPGSKIQFANIGFYDPVTSVQGNLQCIILVNPHNEIKDVHLEKPKKLLKEATILKRRSVNNCQPSFGSTLTTHSNCLIH
jgi:DnaJ-class molecular chaperone